MSDDGVPPQNGSETPDAPRTLELPSDESTIRAICESALAVTEPLEIRETLVRIMDAARRISGARYGACGVRAEGEGFLHFVHSGMDAETAARLAHPPEGKGLLGLILHEDRPVRTAQISSHDASSGFPANHPPMTSFLGQPVIYRGRNVGNIYLTDKEDGTPFDEQDELALGVLAAFAGVAISNAHQFHQVNTELAARDSELDQAKQTLQALSSRVLWLLESERRLIAQELHDGIGQVLAGASWPRTRSSTNAPIPWKARSGSARCCATRSRTCAESARGYVPPSSTSWGRLRRSATSPSSSRASGRLGSTSPPTGQPTACPSPSKPSSSVWRKKG